MRRKEPQALDYILKFESLNSQCFSNWEKGSSKTNMKHNDRFSQAHFHSVRATPSR